MAAGITSRAEDYSRWYTDIILKSEMADYSPVKGCMVIRPNGYAIWENIQKNLDRMIKETGHVNAYFPLFVPESFLRREAEHVEGFAPECAVVTHGGGKELEEPLVVRPTSETIMYEMYSKWIQSYRDLPVMINQWANVVRWEMRTRLFLRTTEFLWQEGHTAHATHEEAIEETLKMLDVYATFAKEYMAFHVIKGVKSQSEKFAGALETYAIESMVQDKKGLQAGTSHDLGQNFAKAFKVQFQSEEGKLEHVWQTSWGVSTRLIGALIMAHSDDQGLVVPPKLAPLQTVVVPIWKAKDKEAGDKVCAVAKELVEKLTKAGISSKADTREGMSPGFKFNDWELKGVPLRIEIGPKDMEKNQVVMVQRIDRTKEFLSMDNVVDHAARLLDEIQNKMYENSKNFLLDNTKELETYDEFKDYIGADSGFVKALWCGDADCEAQVKDETKATIRCLPFEDQGPTGVCIHCGKPADKVAIFGKAY